MWAHALIALVRLPADGSPCFNVVIRILDAAITVSRDIPVRPRWEMGGVPLLPPSLGPGWDHPVGFDLGCRFFEVWIMIVDLVFNIG